MRRIFIVGMLMIGMTLIESCSNEPNQKPDNSKRSEKKIVQGPDGTISLHMKTADCYSDMIHPSSNTAEWNVVILKSGRFNVWLSSATMDTLKLHYNNSVMLNIHENRLEAKPNCDKVILNSKDVNYPYFRADSFMGSLYIQDTGLYNIQVISDKIIPEDYKDENASVDDYTKLLSVVLTPATR